LSIERSTVGSGQRLELRDLAYWDVNEKDFAPLTCRKGRSLTDSTTHHLETDEDFIWKHGSTVVALTREADRWRVSYLVTSRLLGPRQVLYEGIHKDAKMAAWDVMARVTKASHSEDEGVTAAKHAVQWMKKLLDPDVGAPCA